MGDEERALADYDEAIRLSPNYHVARINRARLRGPDRRQDAIEDLTVVLHAEPANVEALRERMNLHAAFRSFSFALADADALLRAEPGDAELRRRRAEFAGRMREPDQSGMRLNGPEVAQRFAATLRESGARVDVSVARCLPHACDYEVQGLPGVKFYTFRAWPGSEEVRGLVLGWADDLPRPRAQILAGLFLLSIVGKTSEPEVPRVVRAAMPDAAPGPGRSATTTLGAFEVHGQATTLVLHARPTAPR